MESIWICFLLALIAFEHFAFLVLEMFLWQKPIGLKIFRISESAAANSAQLAMNQGLYNGFLAAGLVWALVSKRVDVAIFFCNFKKIHFMHP